MPLEQISPEAYLAWLPSEGYSHARLLLDGRWAALVALGSTVPIVVGTVGDMHGYDDRWCYRNAFMALAALDGWAALMAYQPDDPVAREPVGWHRHPLSGRRRAETDDEYDQDGNRVPTGQIYVRF